MTSSTLILCQYTTYQYYKSYARLRLTATMSRQTLGNRITSLIQCCQSKKPALLPKLPEVGQPTTKAMPCTHTPPCLMHAKKWRVFFSARQDQCILFAQHVVCLKTLSKKMEFGGPVCRKYDKKSKGFYSNNNIPHLCTSSHTRELNKLKTTTFN